MGMATPQASRMASRLRSGGIPLKEFSRGNWRHGRINWERLKEVADAERPV